jgi:hypothetical protein
MMRTQTWRAMANSAWRATWCNSLALYYDQCPLDFDPAGMDAPLIYATILKRLAAERKVEYGELTFFGDTRYSPHGAALRKGLQRAASELFLERLRMPADVYEGPAMNHSYHEMIIGHGKCFSTTVLSEKQEQLPAARYTADYHVAQFLATRLALAQRGRPVVAITVRNLGQPALEVLADFFHRAAAHLKSCKL